MWRRKCFTCILIPDRLSLQSHAFRPASDSKLHRSSKVAASKQKPAGAVRSSLFSRSWHHPQPDTQVSGGETGASPTAPTVSPLVAMRHAAAVESRQTNATIVEPLVAFTHVSCGRRDGEQPGREAASEACPDKETGVGAGHGATLDWNGESDVDR